MTENSSAAVVKPPRASLGAMGWMREHLFSSPFNAVLTVLVALVLVKLVPPLVDWALLHATFFGTPHDCRQSSGACWAVIGAKGRFVLFGTYPYDQQWRPVAAIAIFLALVAVSLRRENWKGWLGLVWLAGVGVIGGLMWGGFLGLRYVPDNLWGGLPLTLALSMVAIVLSFPLAIVLALGRRSELPVFRSLSVAYIELVRGVPLISVLFMASVMLPLFLPEGVTIDKVLRAQVGFTLFTAAYLAEVIRAGLQAVPKGQYEAADALGLSYWQKMRLIVLPQALRLVIPPIVNTFIAMFKDTSLVIIIGLFDLLGTVKAALDDPEWRIYYIEGYLFAAAIYWAFCFFMSRYSQRLESAFGVGRRR